MRWLLHKLRARSAGGDQPADRGFILIVVLSALGVLALVAASFAQITSSHVRAAASAAQSAAAEALADAGVQLAIFDLVTNRQPQSNAQRRFALDGSGQVCDAGDGRWLLTSVQDEAGKVDVNFADERLLRALVAGVGIRANAAVADSIMDFRDSDNDRRPQGAERAEYLEAGRPQGPKNAPLIVVDELEQVLGLTAADVALLRQHVTVYSGQTAIEPSSASSALIAILNRGHAWAGVFTTTATEAEAATAMETQAPTEPENSARQLPPEFVGGSGRRVFSIRSEAHTASAVFVREAVVELAASRARPYTLRRWFRGSLPRDPMLRPVAGAPLAPC
jgi:general secretion pathway protein K